MFWPMRLLCPLIYLKVTSLLADEVHREVVLSNNNTLFLNSLKSAPYWPTRCTERLFYPIIMLYSLVYQKVSSVLAAEVNRKAVLSNNNTLYLNLSESQLPIG